MEMFKSLFTQKAAGLAAATLALGMAVLPMSSAEARYYRNGYMWGGVAAGALVGGALLAQPRAYAAPGYYAAPAYVEGPECYFVRERVWDDYRGRWVRVKRRICE
jgi:hypothetical protein